MSEPIGRADYELAVDYSAVKPAIGAAEKEFLDSGKKIEGQYKGLGGRIGPAVSTGLSVGLKLVAGSAATAFAFATKGAIELTNVTADFRAETGATEVEAKRAGKAINDMSGHNIQGIGEIGTALTKVHTEMGLTGDEAEQTTQRFLRFARATKQDAGQAVVAFDGILDAWGLTARDAQAVMDKLIVSHQKYGGEISANQQALASLGPVLKGLNLTIDDGIGLLNLFASSGLDASVAQNALNTAITKLPKGETLQAFIKRLSQVTDDGARAQLAMTVFGQRAGAKLANAIKPGVDSLDAFKIATDLSTGATERAADALDSTFGAQAQLLLKKFGSALNEAGQSWGPMLTGIASLGSLAGGLGIDTFLSKFGPKLVNGLKAVGMKAGDAVGDGISAVVSGAQGTVLGNFVASRIEAIADPTKSTLVGNAWRAAATKAGLIYGATTGAAIAAGSWLANSMTSVFTKLPGSGAVRAAVLASGIKLGTMQGTAMGSAFAIAAQLAVVAGVAMIADAVAPAINQAGRDMHDMIFQGPLAGIGDALEGVGSWLTDLPWPLGPKGAPDWAGGKADTTAGLKTALVDPVGSAVTDVGAALVPLGDAVSHGMTTIRKGIADGSLAVKNGAVVFTQSFHTMSSSAHGASVGVKTATTSIITSIRNMRSTLVSDAQTSADAIWDPQIKAAELAQTKIDIAAKTHIINDKKSTKAEIREATLRRLELRKTLFVQQADLTTYGDNASKITKQKAELARILASKEYRKGTVEQKTALGIQVTNLRAAIADEERAAGKGGVDIRDGLIGPLRKGAPAAKKAAETLVGGAKAPMSGLKFDAKRYGENAGQALADGLNRKVEAAAAAAFNLAHAVAQFLRISSPAEKGPWSEAGGPEGWGKRLGTSMAKGLEGTVPSLTGMIEGALRIPTNMTAPALSIMSSARPTTIHRIEHHITADSARNLAAAGLSPREIGDALIEGTDATGLLSNLRSLQAMTSG